MTDTKIAARVTDVGALAVDRAELNAQIRIALKTSLYPGATDASVDLVLSYCQAGGLDPLTKPVHLVPMSIKVAGTNPPRYEMRDVVMPGIELYRIKAHRSHEYMGMSETEFGPTIEEKFVDGAKPVRYPEWCAVTVYRRDPETGKDRVFPAKVYWLETYSTASKDSPAPNAMWRKRPFGQIEKCAEAAALRKAFPEFVGAQPTADEMIGKTIDVEQETAAAGVTLPKRIEKPAPETAQDAPQGATGSEGAETAAAEPAAAGAGAPAGEGGDREPVDKGIHLAAGQERVLRAKMKAARISEEKLLERWPSVSAGNVNEILAELRTLAEAEGNEDAKS